MKKLKILSKLKIPQLAGTLFLPFACAFVFWACDDRKTNSGETGTQTEVQTAEPVLNKKAPEFSGDSAYYFVARQVKFGPRVPNSAAHRQCGDYLIATLKKYGADVTVQSFTATAYDGTKLQARNIVGSYNPQAQKRILLAAHWDTRHVADQDTVRKQQPIDGANDGASGVGVLLEVARVLSAANPKPTVGVDIILFDVEDYGLPEFLQASEFPLAQNQQTYCLGSQHWGKNPHKPGYSAYFGILLDMVGAKNTAFYREGVSVKYAGGVVDKVWAIGQALGYGQYFRNEQAPEITDDHVFVNEYAKIPTIDIIDFNLQGNFAEHWHTHNDTMDVIDKNTLKAVGQTVVQVVWQE